MNQWALEKEKSGSDEQMYQHMVSEVQDYAILLLDKEGFIQNWNKGAEKIKGYRAQEIVGRNSRIFYPTDDQRRGLQEQLQNYCFVMQCQNQYNNGRVCF